jgi:hypothetical protein
MTAEMYLALSVFAAIFLATAVEIVIALAGAS